MLLITPVTFYTVLDIIIELATVIFTLLESLKTLIIIT